MDLKSANLVKICATQTQVHVCHDSWTMTHMSSKAAFEDRAPFCFNTVSNAAPSSERSSRGLSSASGLSGATEFLLSGHEPKHSEGCFSTQDGRTRSTLSCT